MVNSVDPDETAHYELSHLDLHCLQKCLFESVWPKRVKEAILENVDWMYFVSELLIMRDTKLNI